jgi:2-dehydropantoate 2-reductase
MKTSITIAGIGGVGGYFGGLLAKHFYQSKEVEINFIARAEHLKEIQSSGLTVRKAGLEFVAKPHRATVNAQDIGYTNYLIICTKSYDLETILHQLEPCINPDTIILPLLNGVDSRERIISIYPNNLALDGCAYIVARLIEPGKVENLGNIQSLYFGIEGQKNERLEHFENLFKQAGIEATLTTDILSILWEKYVFISPTATATSYFNNSIGELLADENKLSKIKLLIEEVKQIADAKGISLASDISDRTLNKLKSLPYEATSSMHSDFKNKKVKTELETLTAYVLRNGEKFDLDLSTYKLMYKELLTRS